MDSSIISQDKITHYLISNEVDKNNGVVFRQNNSGFAWEFFIVEFISKPCAWRNLRTNKRVWLPMFRDALYAAHIVGAGFLIVNVHGSIRNGELGIRTKVGKS
jgi:hypothetical protein